MKLTLSVRSFQVPRYAAHFGLAAQFAFGTHFARHARDFGGEGVELVHHDVDGVFEFENFALHVYRNLLAEVAVSHRRCHQRNVSHLIGEVAGQAS